MARSFRHARRVGGLVHIEEQVGARASQWHENAGLAFDLAKTLVESVCRTVLNERAIAYSEDDDLPKLFKTISQSLALSAAYGERGS